MQSSLDNPSSARARIRQNSRVTRLLVFEIATGRTERYVYLQEKPGLSNSDIHALSNTQFVVLERDGEFPNDPDAPAQVKRFYRIDLTGATDVSDPANAPGGLMLEASGTMKTLEQMTVAEILAAGIVPAARASTSICSGKWPNALTTSRKALRCSATVGWP